MVVVAIFSMTEPWSRRAQVVHFTLRDDELMLAIDEVVVADDDGWVARVVDAY